MLFFFDSHFFDISRAAFPATSAKSSAAQKEESFFHANEPFSKIDIDDVYDTMQELYRHDYLFMDITGNCELTSEAIAHLESRFKNGIVDVLSFLAQFIP